MTILDEIIKHKYKEVKSAKAKISIVDLEKSDDFERSVIPMSETLKHENQIGVIAEIKRMAPSGGRYKTNIDIAAISQGYIKAGASALSILTDSRFFDGSIEDVKQARKVNACPILRKEFIVDEYQVIETKSIGADCLLLIAACLSVSKCQQLAKLAQSIDLEVILEVHNEIEVDQYINENINIVGVNNRNLTNFTTDVQTSMKLVDSIPSHLVKISESGISNPSQINALKKAGYKGFLIGTAFMKSPDPVIACQSLIEQTKILA